MIADEIARGRGRRGFDLGDLEGLAEAMRTFDETLTSSTLGRAFVDPRGWSHEALCALFERLVTRHCISHVANVGRAYRVTWSLSRDVHGSSDELEALVHALDGRAAFWTHGSGGFSEGIHGWLDTREATDFAGALRGVHPDPDESDDVVAHAARIARICAVAELASTLGRGLLWGADLDVLYDRWRDYDGGAHTPIEL